MRNGGLNFWGMGAGMLAAVGLFCGMGRCAGPAGNTSQIIVDQFGYRASATRKVALFSNPIKGQNAGEHFVPGASFQLRRQANDSVAFEGTLQAWREGAVDPISGDQVWTADFSAFDAPGEYYLYDGKNNVRSGAFRIDDDVYDGVLKAAVRMFYYQRCGIELTAEHAGKWTHAACHVGAHQTREAAAAPGSGSSGHEQTPRDVSGGWHDAGDYNKYMPFLAGTVWNLLSAYEENPGAFGDDYNIPESGNGVPDVLDEIKWELDWMLKMQVGDGSVSNRVAEASYGNGSGPEKDTQAQYVTAPTTWATATFAALTAHASKTFKAFDRVYPKYSAKLLAASERAWRYLEANPKMLPGNGQDGAKMAAAPGGSDAHDDARRRVYAAAELFYATGGGAYRDYFEKHYDDFGSTGDGNFHPLKSYADPSRGLELNYAFCDYAISAGATAAVAAKTSGCFTRFAEEVAAPAYAKAEDPYLAFMWAGHYCWGSNQLKANWGDLVLEAARFEGDAGKKRLYAQIAEEYVHYFHGRNPLSLCYLTNMGPMGADLGAWRSVMHPYHGWFNNPVYSGADTKIGPAPGYLVGGPNQFFSVGWISPPHGEPAAKAFKDWNGSWNEARHANEASWEITEPAIYYQAAYVHLLSHFCGTGRRGKPAR